MMTSKKEKNHGLDLYNGEMISFILGDKPGVTVSLQLPEKVWYIDGKLVLTNLRLVFLPTSIQGDFFPRVFIRDQASYLSIYLPNIDHLVLVQSQRKKTKVRSFTTTGQSASLPSKVDKLEINCCDFTRYKFCFNSLHRQRRSLLEGISKGGAINGGGSRSVSQLNTFSESLRASLMDGINRTRGNRGSERQDASVASTVQQQQQPQPVDEINRLLSNLCLFAFGSRQDAESSSSLFHCQRLDYQDIMLKSWSAADCRLADVTVTGGSRVILPLVPLNRSGPVDQAAIEYYREAGHPRLVLSYTANLATVVVLRSARPKDDSASEASSSFFKQSMEYEDCLKDQYPNLEIFDCDQKLPPIRLVSEARRKLLRHSVASATGSDNMSLDRLRKNDSSDAGFYSGLEATGWLRLVHQCLDTAAQLAQSVHNEHKSIWLVESADRDWNCLLASLIRLMLCTDCRSIEGFERLVQLEWLTRHPFRARLLNLGQLDEPDDGAACNADQVSIASGVTAPVPSPGATSSGNRGGGGPLFLLFLDCAWQLTRREPSSFEMSSVYLTLLHDTVQWPVFQENATACIDEILFPKSGPTAAVETGSLFRWQAYVSPGVCRQFVNSLYRPVSSATPSPTRKRSAGASLDAGYPLFQRWQACELQFWTENYSRNARFAASDKLMPGTVYSAPTRINLQRILYENGAELTPPTRQACFYGNQPTERYQQQQQEIRQYNWPFSWAAGKIVDQLLRNHLREVGADFTQQLDPRNL